MCKPYSGKDNVIIVNSHLSLRVLISITSTNYESELSLILIDTNMNSMDSSAY